MMQTIFRHHHSRIEQDPTYSMGLKMNEKLKKRGLTTKLHIIDNDVSEDLNQYFEDSDVQLQLVPPHMHKINAAERNVITFKNHFIAALCTLEHLLPFYLWGRLLPQFTTTINMYWRSQLNPELSAYEQVDDIHYFERTS